MKIKVDMTDHQILDFETERKPMTPTQRLCFWAILFGCGAVVVITKAFFALLT